MSGRDCDGKLLDIFRGYSTAIKVTTGNAFANLKTHRIVFLAQSLTVRKVHWPVPKCDEIFTACTRREMPKKKRANRA